MLKAEPKTTPQMAQAGQAEDRLSIVFILVFLSLVIPVFAQIAGLHLSISRVLLLLAFPVLFFNTFTGKYGPVVATDVFMVLYVIWLALSIFVNNRSVFVTFVGSNAVIILGGYLVGRAYIRGPGSFMRFSKIYGVLLIAALPFALYETVTSSMPIARLIDQLPLVSSSSDVDYPPRRGFYRVQVVFTHPIHFGLFAALCFSLIFIGFKDRLSALSRYAWGAVIGVCCFLAVSSGPLLALATQLLLIGYAKVTAGVRRRWSILIGVLAAGYVILDLVSTRPAYFAIVERLAFSSGTAYSRKILLEYGVLQVRRTPILGVGYNDWALPPFMTGSVDNYWLLTALVYGLPALIFILSAFLYTLIRVGRSPFQDNPLLQHIRMGWSLICVSLLLCLSTVAIWSDVATLVFLLLGSGVWMIHYRPADPSGSAAQAPPAVASNGPKYTRFPKVMPASSVSLPALPSGPAARAVMPESSRS